MVEQVSVFLENRPGRLAQLARAMGDANINMRALMVADTAEFGVVRIITDRPHEARQVLDAQGFSVQLTPVVAVEIPDRPGGLADVLETLSDRSISVEYAYCFVEPWGEGAAVDVLKVDDVEASSVLRDAGFTVLSSEELYASDDE
jgi:hypothetical protein